MALASRFERPCPGGRFGSANLLVLRTRPGLAARAGTHIRTRPELRANSSRSEPRGISSLWPGRPSMCSLVRSPARRAAWAHGASAGRVRAFPSKADSGFQFLSSFAAVLGPAGGPNTPGLASECESSFRSAALSSRIPLNRTGSHPQGPKRRERKGTRLNGCVGKSPREGRGAMEAETLTPGPSPIAKRDWSHRWL